ncbi:MAG TPA: serine/threonine protein kinase [Cyanobacteria bacterium UBA11372]|nr:serine/threonine protein kinase [Cyanobacteria bacterium UBA11372]
MAATADLTIALPGYHLEEQIYSGSRTVVYRGVQEKGEPRRVAIKLLRQEYPTFNDLLQFRNQYAIAKNLEIPGIVRLLCLESYRNSYALVMEDFVGVSLREYSQKGNLSWEQVLDIALQLTDILYYLHAARVIHKDIKPDNILIHPETKQVKLIDFSIASLLPKETQEIKNPNVLEGTLAYLSPEQTGRMNRGIDYRADFYALGVTLFELFTGELPFQSDDPMELVHCHIAKQPPSVCDRHPDLPIVVAKIIGKLMAKNAEDRYQSELGLKHDLQICLEKLQATGKIEDFEIATRDGSDRFIIPDKLYGREAEVKVLLDAFERIVNPSQSLLNQGELRKAELMLLAGVSGIGKTAVINEVHKPIVRQRGYFIKGKFDQFNRNIPLSAFVQALRDLMGQLLSESDAQLAQWRSQILAAVAENGQVLIEVIPELKQIIGQQPPAPELSGMAAQNRFNLLFQKFIEVFTTKEHPLVIFLDDLQWADSASLQLMKLLVEGKNYLLLLGAYRDNEVSPVHPLILTVEELKQAEAIVNTMTLEALAFDDTNHLVADTLNCATNLAKPLTELILRKTKGNPFFTTQFLKALYEDGQIRFNCDRCYWECDISQVNALSLTDDVVEFVALQLQKLPAKTQEILKLAACIGNQFDLDTLAIVSERSPADVADALWKALQEELILPIGETYKFFQFPDSNQGDIASEIAVPYKFLHDRVQQAAYSLIPQEQKQITHGRIGSLLWRNCSEAELEQRIFAIANHLNLALVNPSSQQFEQPVQRTDLARLNLLAAKKAKASTAYPIARHYVQTGLELLPADAWESTEDLALALYELSAEIHYLLGNITEMEQDIETVLDRTSALLKQIKVYELRIQAYSSLNRMNEALQITLKILRQLGIDLPDAPTESDIQSAADKIAAQLGDVRVDSLLDLPPLSDPEKQAAMRLLSITNITAYLCAPALFPLNVFKQVELSYQYGNSRASACAYTCYGLILCGTVSEIPTGYQFGQLALRLLERGNSDFQAKTLIFTHLFVTHWQEHLKNTLQPFLNAYQLALMAGELEDAALALQVYCAHGYFSGMALDVLNKTAAEYAQAIADLNQQQILDSHNIYQQAVLQLIGTGGENQAIAPWSGVFDQAIRLPQLAAANNITAIFEFHLHKLILCCIFADWIEGWNLATAAEKNLDSVQGLLYAPIFYFYQSLIYLALCKGASDVEIRDYLQRVIANQSKLQQWADYAPMNQLHRCHLIAAEKHRVLGERSDAIEFYDRAIAAALENSYIQEAAIANELAAKFYLEWGKEKVAAGYMQEAYYCYAKWGAKAKTDDLEQCYPHLLRPIRLPVTSSLNPLETLTSIAPPTLSIHDSKVLGGCINTSLDFAAILKASQSLSGAIQLEQLLHQLTQIILRYSGGDRCALILPNAGGEWQVEAIATPETTELLSIPLNRNENLPVKLIHYVKNTQEVVAIDNLKTPLPVIDDYLIQAQPKSLLCLPVLNQGQSLGILLVENRVTSGVFTGDRLEILQLLTAQAAISLKNAQLYHQLEEKVQQRTQDLQEKNQLLSQTLNELQQTQAQLIQSEKMSSLGQLVAGIAHEINNPISFIYSNLTYAEDYSKTLLEVFDRYAQASPAPNTAMQNQLEDIPFIRQDLPRLLGSMKVGAERIRKIVLELRNFARLDESEVKTVDIHQGIESTLIVVQHRCQANSHRPEIQIVKHYDKLPKINCYAKQINQVFMNILMNAIDAIDAMESDRWNLDIQPAIAIRTGFATDNRAGITIQIADNGVGIPDKVKQRIFEPFFTTKAPGQSTGLGLSASYAIVTKQGGSIDVISAPGQGSEFTIFLPS